MPLVPIYVINLDRDVARLQYLQALFARHGMSFERVEAVDGRRLGELHGPEIVPVKPTPRFPRGVLIKDQGLTMSHRKAALRLLSTDLPACCIMEDDVGFDGALPRLLERLAAEPPADIVKLEGIGTARRVAALAPFEDRVLAMAPSPIMGAAAYLATRRGAQAIVDLTETVGQPADHVLADIVPVVHVLPYPVIQRPEAGVAHSQDGIRERMDLAARLNRECHRLIRDSRHAISMLRRSPLSAFQLRRTALQQAR